jgi:hypothetical protein
MERNRIFDLARKAYDLRSKVAHCVKLKAKDYLSQEDQIEIGQFAHLLIQEALKLGIEPLKNKIRGKLLG